MEDEQYRQVILESIEAMLEVQLRSVRQLLGRDARIGALTRRPVRKRKSLVDLSVEVLTTEKRAVHVDELVTLLKERHDRLTDRDSLSSALAKKDRQGILVRRTAPGTFIVREDG
jgi:hypothetical protein